jgi:hypothetical protein
VFTQWFFPVAILLSLVIAAVVALRIDLTVGVRGLYASLGLAVSSLIYHFFPSLGARESSRRAVRWSEKGVYLVAVSSLGAAALLERRFVVLVTLLPLGYLLFFLQIRALHSPARLLPQVGALFIIAPLTKYLTTGFYFGNGDILFHTAHVAELLDHGTVVAIDGQYQVFPGLHVIVGGISLLTELAPYDALLITGVMTYALLALSVIYLFGQKLFANRHLAVCVALAGSAVYSISFYATYFFPQALGIVLLVAVIYVTWRTPASVTTNFKRLTAVVFLILLGALFTHHLSFILTFPILVSLVAISLLQNARASDRTTPVLSPRLLPLATGMLAGITYWTEVLPDFIFGLFWWMRKIVRDVFSGSPTSGSGPETLFFGTSVPKPTIEAALSNLFWVNSVYLWSLVAVFSLGVVTFVERHTEFRQATSLSLVSVLSAVLIFKIPLVIPGQSRIRLPFAFFFAFIAGLGVYRAIEASRTTSIRKVLPLVLVVLVATSGPLYVQSGDDLYNIHDPPNGPHQKQVELTSEEYRSVMSVHQFEQTHGVSLRAVWIDSLALNHFGASVDDGPRVTDAGVTQPSGALLYRTRWTDHAVHYTNGSSTFGKFVLSEQWLRRNVQRSNKIYDTGHAGVLWDDNRITLRDRG